MTDLFDRPTAGAAAPGGVPMTPRAVMTALTLATAIGSLGLGAGGTAGALVAVELTGRAAAAGWPLGVLVVGQAVGALLISRVTRLADRWIAVAGGYGIGAAGAVLVVLAGQAGSFPAMLFGSFLLGAANAAVMLTRYAVVEVTEPEVRGRALGTVFSATAVGAVAGVFVLGPSATLAAALGVSGFLGLYLLALLAFVAAACVLLRLRASLRGRHLVGAAQRAVREDASDRTGALWVPLGLLAVTNLAMTAIMVVAPVHLHSHGQALQAIGVITALHVLLMFGPSAVTGWLADRAGGLAVATAGLGTLAIAALAGGVVDAANPWATTCFLALLGLGWNAGVVGGSALLATSVSGLRAEGYGETAMGFAAAVGSPAASTLVAGGGFGVLCLAVATAAVLGAVVLGVAERRRNRQRQHI
jgi:MFS family permease